ncbi:cobalt-precorrin-4/precorrin-4 C(11)-methyltransferase [Methanoplanus sp. FWC-SCC4]|uniref:Cobalt-precorrin-4/precorrin-4 C(11)-methyltransferase n=1 Tax=Methanochimaera problematica TaxID=2609417 RepID=A0AA97FCR2_9EURY|nr:SAM-dependent methyltransferase [Methanoplanus sp. FWC-SCC4]WOF15829.1 cobalt-precorrin-4/precorrin-4 C(11)-methyltransferase [Methanoplanus sp. FWC-SCC4]
MNGKVYIVGAGCGDPELITVKGKKILDKADVLIYAGSLVNPELVEDCPAPEKFDSWGMKLEDMTQKMVDSAKSGLCVVRLHSGDPSLYGAIIEQAALLEKAGIIVERVPGVSSMFGAAAALETQLTLRGVSESVIVTRPAGTTLEKDQIAEMSRLGQTMVIFLGTEHMEEVFEKVECPPETPAAVVYRATWPDEKVIKGTVSDVAKKAREAGIDKTALIIIGNVVDAVNSDFVNSHLYE